MTRADPGAGGIRHRLSRMQWVDLGIAVGAAIIALTEVLTQQVTGPPWATVTSALLFSLPLARRWTDPWWVFGIMYATLVFCRLTGVDLDNYLGSIIGPILALATVAALAPVGRSLVAVAVAVAVLMLTAVSGTDGLIWVSFLTISAWAAGWLIGERRLLILRLRATTEELERSREQHAQAAVATERTRIARELHDIVAHSVSVMVVQAQAAERTAATDPTASLGAMRAVQETGRQSLHELRRLLGVLRAADPDASTAPQPGLDQVEDLAEAVRGAGISVEIHRSGLTVPLAPGVELAAYRILQEALTNVVKHAGAARVTVAMAYADGILALEVSDDGSGGEPLVPGSGEGIIGMRERALLYDGRVLAGPAPEGGFTVHAELRVDEAPA